MTKIQGFLQLQTSKSAVISYRRAIMVYLEFIYGEKLKSKLRGKNDLEVYKEFTERYFNEKRNYGEDLVKFVVFLQNKGIAPKTINVYISSVKQWLLWNTATIEAKYLSILRKKKPKANLKT
jgi:site-specific recombinase XerD